MEPRKSAENRSSLELLRSAQAGDAGAVETIYQRYTPPLKRWAHGRLPRWARDLLDTEDLVHEALTRTLNHLGKIEYPRAGAFQAYMRRALRNRLLNEIDRARRKPFMKTLEDGFQQSPSPLEELVGKEAMERFEKAFDGLPEADQELIVARIEMGMSYAEVAEATQRPTADAARMATSRALARLVRKMSS